MILFIQVVPLPQIPYCAEKDNAANTRYDYSVHDVNPVKAH